MPSENYVISLQKVYDDKPRTRRANKAITVVYDFFKKHTRKEKKDIIISKEVNEYIWKRSIQKPPRKVSVSIKLSNDKVYVFLKDSKEFKEFGKVSEKKEKSVKKAKDKKETTKDKKQETQTKEEKPKKEAEAPVKTETKQKQVATPEKAKKEVKQETAPKEKKEEPK